MKRPSIRALTLLALLATVVWIFNPHFWAVRIAHPHYSMLTASLPVTGQWPYAEYARVVAYYFPQAGKGADSTVLKADGSLDEEELRRVRPLPVIPEVPKGSSPSYRRSLPARARRISSSSTRQPVTSGAISTARII